MRRSLPSLLAALLLALGLVACGDDQAQVEQNPTEALRQAISELADYDGIELTFSIAGDAEAAQEAGMSAEEYELLSASSLLLRATGEDEDTQLQLVLNLRDSEAADVRFLGGDRLFARIDLDAIGDEIDDPGFQRDLDEVIDAARMFGLGAAAESLREGEWIEVTGIDQLATMFEEEAGEPDTPSEEEFAQLQQRMAAALERFVEQDAEVTAIGSEDAGERVRITATGEDLDRLFTELASIVDDVSGGVDPSELQGEFDDVDTVTVDAWISGGRLTQVGLDIGQFEEDIDADRIFFLVGIDEFRGSVDAPSAATQLDVFELMGSMFGEDGDLTFDEDLDEDVFLDEDFEDGFGDEAECITEEELAELREFMGDEEADAFEELIEQGFIDRC